MSWHTCAEIPSPASHLHCVSLFFLPRLPWQHWRPQYKPHFLSWFFHIVVESSTSLSSEGLSHRPPQERPKYERGEEASCFRILTSTTTIMRGNVCWAPLSSPNSIYCLSIHSFIPPLTVYSDKVHRAALLGLRLLGWRRPLTSASHIGGTTGARQRAQLFYMCLHTHQRAQLFSTCLHASVPSCSTHVCVSYFKPV